MPPPSTSDRKAKQKEQTDVLWVEIIKSLFLGKKRRYIVVQVFPLNLTLAKDYLMTSKVKLAS